MFGLKRAHISGLIAVVSIAFISLVSLYFFRADRGNSDTGINSYRVLYSVPVDAVGLWVFNNSSSFNRVFFADSSPMASFLNKDCELCKFYTRYLKSFDDEMQVSLHYSGKNEVMPLMTYNLSGLDEKSRESLIAAIYSSSPGEYRKLSDARIDRLSGLYFSIYYNFLILSQSPLLVESSIRHLSTGSSILDNDELQKIDVAGLKKDNIVIVNHSQIGKLFSGLASYPYLKYADFFSKLTSWSIMSASIDDGAVMFDGLFYNNRGAANFASALNWRAGKIPYIADLIPDTPTMTLSLSFDNFSNNIENLRRYKEFVKKYSAVRWESARGYYDNLNINSVTLVSFIYNGNNEWMTIVKNGGRGAVFEADTIIKNVNPTLTGELFGSIFALNGEEYLLCEGDWIFMGSYDALEMVRDKFNSDYESKRRVERAVLKVNISLAGVSDYILDIFKSEYSGVVKRGILTDDDLELTFKMESGEDMSAFKLLLNSKNKDKKE